MFHNTISDLQPRFGLYIHIPFCQTKCPYCDFNSYETSNAEMRLREQGYVNALLREMEVQSDNFNCKDRIVETIFIGGGTPSLLSGKAIENLLRGAKSIFSFSDDIEITIEANPASLKEKYSERKLESYRKAGINRISFGAQSFIEKKLKFLGRWHKPEDIINSFKMARSVGFENCNLDLMFGIKEEKLSEWVYELNRISELSPEHISAYMLTMEPGTVFGKLYKKGRSLIIDDEGFVDLYESAQSFLRERGYVQYEISNFSKPKFSCKHNILYWSVGEYLGLGAGAHSYIRSEGEYGLRWSNTPSPKVYVSRVMDSGSAIQRKDPLTREKVLLEEISLSLRMTKGLRVDDRIKTYSESLVAQELFNKNFLCKENEFIKIPDNKLYLADEIVSEFCSSI